MAELAVGYLWRFQIIRAQIEHVKEYPTMHHFGIPRHIYSMILGFDLALLRTFEQKCFVGILLMSSIACFS